ncbi:MAG: glucosidase II beta subunit-like-domain-containing protein [Monoraphidium minutum]|nr:MAG: glucosidase II beta subunit-like-domain-containing protein [Monoraphidium minutum]
MGARLPLAGLLALLAVIGSAQGAAHIRGVQPEQASKYEPVDGKWTCLDGSKTLDFERVNDAYCDCPDGSDEPGTSACANGVFYCRNRGHEARVLSTSFVDDGVCDCCDGSDELEGCKNTCIERNAAVREGLKAKVEDYRRALARRQEYAAGAADARRAMKERLAGIDAEIAAAEAAVEARIDDRIKLEGTAEERQAARLEARKEEVARLKAEAAAAAEADAEAAAAAAAAAAEIEAATAAAAEAGGGGEGAEGGEAPAAGEEEESVEERGRRIAAQWTNDPEAAGEAAADAEGGGDGAEGEAAAAADAGAAGAAGLLTRAWSKLKDAIGGGGGADADADAPAAGGGEEDEAVCEEPTCYDSEAPKEGGEEHEIGDMSYDAELQAAMSAVTAAEDAVSTLRGEKERLTRQVTYDYGADDAWIALASQCTDAREPQYTYRLCLFDKAAQVDNHGGHETSLGAWKGFEKGYTEGVFENGDWCHQAPARSMRVTLECGEYESASDASEPSTCGYVAKLVTPAACKKEELQALEDRLAALVAEEAALAKDIAEEDAARRAAWKAAAAAAGDRSEL